MNSGYFIVELHNRKKLQFRIEKECLTSIANFINDMQGKNHQLGSAELVVRHTYVCDSAGSRVIHRQRYDHTMHNEVVRILKTV